MRSLRILDRRVGALIAAIGLMFATMVPSLAAAATITERSIELSSSTKAAAATYRVNFTAETGNTNAVVVDFCDSAAIGTTCNTPNNIAIGTIGTTSAHTVTKIDGNTAKVVLSATAAANDPVTFDISGITNPDTVGPFYARIVTYSSGTVSSGFGYASATDLDGALNDEDPLDTGSVAMSITDGFGVNGAVAETMVFCASGAAIAQVNCSDATAPNITLGNSGVLDTTTTTGTVYTQISTNALHGAVVNLKSSASGCGGLVRSDAATNAAGCGITPLTAGAATIGDGLAKFGMKLDSLSAEDGAVNAFGSYSTTNFYLGYNGADENAGGVTSPYGDTIYDTDDGPINEGKANLIFGANISPITPAGNYSASLSLIATGKF